MGQSYGSVIKGIDVIPAPPQRYIKQYVWTCGNCGHEIIQSNDLAGLNYQQWGHNINSINCPACGSRSIQQAYDDTCTAGCFLIIPAHNKIRGKRRV